MEFSAAVTDAIVSGATVSVLFVLAVPNRTTSSTAFAGKHGPATSPLHVHVALCRRAPCRRSVFCSTDTDAVPGAERLLIACWVRMFSRVVGSLYPRSVRNQDCVIRIAHFQALLIKSESRLHVVSTDFVTKAPPRLGGALGQALVSLGGALGQG